MTDALDVVLAASQEWGFLGPGPIAQQRAHADAFLTAIDPDGVRVALDLGSGGGLPGLVLALLLPGTTWVLLDAMRRRTAFLQQAVHDLGLDDRVRVVTARAEEAGRTDLRGAHDLVVSRSFGAPPVTAECGTPFLRAGGQLVVSEPPELRPDRWPPAALDQLGLELEATVAGPPHFVRLRALGPVAAVYPRRTGTPAKLPLW